MSATAEVSGHSRDINIVGGAAGDKLDALIESDEHKQCRWLQQFAQFVSQGRDLFCEPRRFGAGNDDRVPFDLVGFALFEQPLVEFALLGRERMVEEFIDDCETGPLFHQPGCRPHVAGGRRLVRKGTGILIDTQQQQRSLDAGQFEGTRRNLLDQQRGRGPHRLAGVGPTGRQFAVEFVMVNDVHLQVTPHALKRDEALCIYQNSASDLTTGKVIGLDERKFSAVERQESTYIAVDATGKDRDGRRKEFACPQQTGDSVEIRIFVGQNDFHVDFLSTMGR